MNTMHYRRLAAMSVLSFIAMFILMYAMVDRFSSVYPSINQFYMAGLMTAPMIVFEIALMGMMYKNKKLNVIIVGASVVLGSLFFLGIREQTAIGNEQFLKSMIPHHAGAILMCGKATITDQEIKALCKEIISGQQREIEQMKGIIRRLDRT